MFVSTVDKVALVTYTVGHVLSRNEKELQSRILGKRLLKIHLVESVNGLSLILVVDFSRMCIAF